MSGPAHSGNTADELRPAPAWHVLSQASERGSARVNEDRAGCHGSQAWILDGSSFFTGPPRLEGSSEGAWLVRTIDRWLQEVATAQMPLADLAAALDASLAVEDAALGPKPAERREGEGPCAVFALLRLRAEGGERRIEAMLLGDVSVLIADGGELTRWTDERVQPFEASTIAAAGGAGRSGEGPIPPQAMAQVIENRRYLNRAGGYWAVSPGQPWRRGLRFLSRSISSDAQVLLASDGFMRLVDVVKAYTEDDLVAAVAARGAESLLAELREIEREDGRATRFARVKIHDDATALLIEPARRT